MFTMFEIDLLKELLGTEFMNAEMAWDEEKKTLIRELEYKLNID